MQHDDGESNGAEIAKEVQHFYVGNNAERRHQKSDERVHRHGEDDEEKECEQQIFQTAQRDVEPAGHIEIAAEDFAAELPEIFRRSADGTKPRAESFFEQQAGRQEYAEKNQRRGMDFRNVARGEQVSEVDEAGDGQPSVHACGAIDVGGSAVALKVADPQQKLNAEEEIEQKKGELNRAAGLLRAIGRQAAHQRFLWFAGCGCDFWCLAGEARLR